MIRGDFANIEAGRNEGSFDVKRLLGVQGTLRLILTGSYITIADS